LLCFYSLNFFLEITDGFYALLNFAIVTSLDNILFESFTSRRISEISPIWFVWIVVTSVVSDWVGDVWWLLWWWWVTNRWINARDRVNNWDKDFSCRLVRIRAQFKEPSCRWIIVSQQR
jgi:hypothetical protein